MKTARLFLIFFIPLCLVCRLAPAASSRLVSLKPNITKTLVALGVADKIVGITKFCPSIANAQVVADYVSLDTEKILRLKPDLVLSSSENSQSRQYESLKAAGIRVVLLDFKTLDDLFAAVGFLGDLLEQPSRSASLIAAMNSDLHAAKNAAANLNGKTFAVIVQRKPLMVATGGTYVSTLLTAIGMKNVFATSHIAYPVLDGESLLRAAPDILFDMEMGHASDAGKPYLGREVIAVNIEEFLAAPESLKALAGLLKNVSQR